MQKEEDAEESSTRWLLLSVLWTDFSLYQDKDESSAM
jgi:hypothetical protein